MRQGDRTFSGVWCASVTPLTEDLSIDTGRMERHVRRLLEEGCDGIALFGSTGEGNSFTVDERAACLRDLANLGLPMDRILVGAGSCAVPDAVRLAGAAGEVGAMGVMMHPPFYYRHASDDGIFAFLESVVRGMGSRGVPVVLYHFPKLVGIGFEPGLLARLRESREDVYVGLKDSSADLERMARIAGSLPGFSVMAGTESLLLPLLERGGAGCLTATTNLTSSLARRVLSDRDPASQERLSAARAALETAPFVSGIKRLLADRDGDEGWLRVRPPLESASPETVARLRAAVAASPPDDSAVWGHHRGRR